MASVSNPREVNDSALLQCAYVSRNRSSRTDVPSPSKTFVSPVYPAVRFILEHVTFLLVLHTHLWPPPA